ncbi:MAG: lamin tail domain-containing protein [Patescibacteria group bacterium]
MRKTDKKGLRKGEAIEGLVLLGALFIIIFAFIMPKKGPPAQESIPSLTGGKSAAWSTTGTSASSVPGSAGSGLSLYKGNAAYEYNPSSEYIEIENRGNASIDITGFRLKNAKDAKTYQVGSNVQRFTSDIAEIPQGSRIIPARTLENIILKPGEKAVIVSGPAPQASPYKVSSFEENSCTGYLANTSGYSFNPGLSLNCPLPRQEAGYANLDRGCQDFLNNFQSCHIPTYNGLDRRNQSCVDCVDGTNTLTSSCVAFIKSHFNYSSCLTNHQDDQDFRDGVWRVYLGRPWEMWAKDRETISLLDRLGNVVTSSSY